MRNPHLFALAAAASLLTAAPTLAQFGNQISYQGRLTSDSASLGTSCDVRFSLWTADTGGGTQIGSTVDRLAVPVSQGLFQTTADFGLNPFTTAQELWLEVAVASPAGSGNFATLAPRQRLTASPYSLSTRGISFSQDQRGLIWNGVGSAPTLPGRLTVADAGGAPTLVLAGTEDNNTPAEIFFDKRIVGPTHSAFVGYSSERGLFSWVNGGDRINILTNGNVGLSTANPLDTLHVNGVVSSRSAQSTEGYVTLNPGSATDAGYLAIMKPGNARVGFIGVNATDLAYTAEGGAAHRFAGNVITQNGLDVAGATTLRSTLNVSGQLDVTAFAALRSGASVGGTLTVNESGNGVSKFGASAGANARLNATAQTIGGSVTQFAMIGFGNFCSTTGVYSNCSDERLKRNITPLPHALASVMALRPVSFDWRADEFPDMQFAADRGSMGFIAQEVQRVLPSLVLDGVNGYLAISSTELIPVLTGAIQDQQRQIDALNRESSDLRIANAALAARLDRLEAALRTNTPVQSVSAATGVSKRADGRATP